MSAGGARLVAGPLSASAARVVENDVAATGPTDPAVFLARLMSLRGSVDLAELLDGALPRDLAPERDPSSPVRAALRALVVERITALRAEVEDTFAEPLQRRGRPPTSADAMTARAPAADRASAAEQLWAPCGQLVARALARTRFELGALREEIGEALAALGPGEARLEQLDAALFETTAERRAALEDRLLDAIGESFARRFTIESSPLAPVQALLRDALDAGRGAVLGILEHDHRRLAALVAAPVPASHHD